MAYTAYDNFWRSEFYKTDFGKKGVQDTNLNQLTLKQNDIY